MYHHTDDLRRLSPSGDVTTASPRSDTYSHQRGDWLFLAGHAPAKSIVNLPLLKNKAMLNEFHPHHLRRKNATLLRLRGRTRSPSGLCNLLNLECFVAL